MGSQGIRRRKPVHHLPKVTEDLEPDEAAAAFGNFRWSQFSPAGSVERVGFIVRQILRRRYYPQYRNFDPVIRQIGWTLIFIGYAGPLVVIAIVIAIRSF